MLNSKQRAYLKSLAQKLDVVLNIGKNGYSPEITNALDEVLETRELVKVGVLQNCLEDPKEMSILLAERTHSEVVQIIGKKIVFYRPSKDNPKIQLPKK
ncbi:MAG: ribosome assembly RNA-binding protein YhbY [Lachnospirales bacterium]